MDRDLSDAIIRLRALGDPARRAAYLALRDAGRPLTRAEVADEIGITVRLAAFHLETLVTDGLLETTYARGEEATSVGHPAKRYRPADLDVEVSIPPRRYDLAAEILAAALDKDASHPPDRTLADVAADYGREFGRQAAHDGEQLLDALRAVGYEPAASGAAVVLRNCPFRSVAEALPDVICREMNLAFIGGVLAGMGSPLHAVLSPSPERCCVIATCQE